MLISDVRIPESAEVVIQPAALLERPELAIYIALIVASWGEIEARLESIFLALIRDEERLAAFKAVNGWPARVTFLSDAVKLTSGERAAGRVRAVLSVISMAAAKRHEVAHGVWLQCKGTPPRLALCTPGTFTQATRLSLKAMEVGSARMETKLADFFEKARIVELEHLQKAYQECEDSRDLLNNFWVEELPDIVKVAPPEPVPKVVEHVEVAARLANAEVSIRRAEKARERQRRIDAREVRD